MAKGTVNKVILVGRLGADPEVRYTPDGKGIANLRLATNESYKDKTGQFVDQTEWHKVSLFGRTAEIAAQYLKKGGLVYIEGRIRTNKWKDQAGQDRYTTEIVGEQMQLMGGTGGPGMGDAPSGAGNSQMSDAPRSAAKPAAATENFNQSFEDDEIPF